MTFIDLREMAPDKLRMIELHDIPEMILRQTGADDILRHEVEKSILANVISIRHLAQISQANLSDGPQLAVHHHEAFLHHGLPLAILMTVKDGAYHLRYTCGRHN